MASLEGRVALVTGASRGIGRAIALELAREGARVALNYRSGEAEARAVAEEIEKIHGSASGAGPNGGRRARALADEVAWRVGSVAVAEGVRISASRERAMLVQADVSDPQEARALVGTVVEKWGKVDILVNNAGITRDRTLRKLSDEDWVAVINTNLNSAFFTSSAAIAVMVEQKYGRIVNVSSVIGQCGNVGQANYAAAKAGMIAFSKCAALELAKYNITVNVVAPGFTQTEMVTKIPENIQESIKARVPLGRFAMPEEIARAVLFLVTEADYITGQQINVNGGIYM